MTIMSIDTTDFDNEPLLASGKATPLGEVLANDYKELAETIAMLEKRREHLRSLILQAAEAEDPKAKSFAAGDHIIRISRSTRRTISVIGVEKERPDLFTALEDANLVSSTMVASVSVK